MAVPGVPAGAAASGSRGERVWRHLDTCQYQTFLHARVPRVDCPTHGVRQVRVPWVEARSRVTLLMKRKFPDGDLLPLWRARPLPTLIPE
jgi:transposase